MKHEYASKDFLLCQQLIAKKRQTNTQLNTNTKSEGSRKLWKFWWFMLIFLEKQKSRRISNKQKSAFIYNCAICLLYSWHLRSFCRIWYFIQWFYFLKIAVNKIFLDEHKTVFIATDNSLCSFFFFFDSDIFRIFQWF